LNNEVYSHLYRTSEKISQLYCLPKVHKEGVSFRPILDYTGSTGYNTSRFLADILAPLVNMSQYSVKNSKQLAEGLSSFRLDEDDILAFHDVVASFTSTPIKESLDVIRERLEQNPEWKYTTLLETEDIMELLESIFSTMYFSFRGQIFRQKFGTAMGSPVSPLVANMFMEHLEGKLHATAPKELKLKV